jgi:hypothetical protein
MTGLAEWFGSHPVATGVATLILMLVDWLLTVLQHRERAKHSANHYRSYPVDTVEGNPSLQRAVARAHLLEPRHLLVAVPVSALVAATVWWMPVVARPLLLGYVWGLFFIVSATHLGNLLGYIGSRRGIHGRVWMHQRTGYSVQAGRYVGVTALLAALAVCSGSMFVIGAAVAGVTSMARQLVWIRRTPPIPDDDAAPEAGATDVGSGEAAERALAPDDGAPASWSRRRR